MIAVARPLRRVALAVLAPLLALLAPTAAWADMASDVKALQDGWAHMTYEVKGGTPQAKALDQLARQADAMLARYPGRAEPLLWVGIVASERANRASIFRKLSYATKARDLIARAYTIDPQAAGGGVALTLGVLYYKVPGSPFAWGDDERAGKLLRQALALDPDGLDANYFYGDYLLAQGDKPGARSHFQRALRAPRDASRPVWDAGRRRDLRNLIAKAG
ncbi:tetratricopeptide repeat protein [Novosphingobium colocasiae]|uniref:tetratricopeptide repeat protein n=1 Tax=Novosphingobium colocasiae TaxID=1256513 RepID=UPI0035ADD308